ncbi:MAG: DUF5667 domain-containing protein [Patescibacteria group bacterium]
MDNSQLIKNLKALKGLEAAGRPQESWVLKNKEILRSQIAPLCLREDREEVFEGNAVYYWQYFSGIFRNRVLKPAMAVALVIMAMIGYSATITVADSSIPGDALYSVKTASEKVQMAFTFSDDKKVQLQMGFVSRRMDELQQVVRLPESDQKKAQKIATAAKNVTSSVQSVKDNLNKINAAFSPTPSAVEAAKEVDSKTLAIKQEINAINQNLSSGIKEAVSVDINQAMNSTDETGASALSVIAKTSGSGIISDAELANLVAERIKTTEQQIVFVAGELNQMAASSTVLVATSTASVNASSTLQNLIAEIGRAQQILETAKDFLDQKDFNSAIQKIQESGTIANQVKEKLNLMIMMNSPIIQPEVNETSTIPLIK